AVDCDRVAGCDIERRRIDDPTVDADASLHDPLFGISARGKPGARQHLCDPLAGLLWLRLFARRTPVGVALAFAIGTAAAKGRALGEALSLLLLLAALEARPAECRAIFTCMHFLRPFAV